MVNMVVIPGVSISATLSGWTMYLVHLLEFLWQDWNQVEQLWPFPNFLGA